MPRFTISQHSGAKDGDHYDLFLEQGEILRTWRLDSPVFASPQAALQIKDHRKLYLDHEGEIDGERGRVKVWDSGVYTADEWSERRLRVALVGRQLRTRLLLVADPESKAPRWTVADATLEVRKATGAFLRGDPLDDAPSPELDPIRLSLSHEEQKLMAVVDQFAKGGAVEWTLAEVDQELRQRIESARVRWQHPWLAGARAYADRLGQLASLVRKQRPGSDAK
jgi:hypothetical protein